MSAAKKYRPRHQVRAGVKEPRALGCAGQRAYNMYEEERPWHWSDSVTLQLIELKLAQIRQQFLGTVDPQAGSSCRPTNDATTVPEFLTPQAV